MWSDENNKIEQIYKDFGNIKEFPAKCPACEHDSAHLYDRKTQRSGLWIWCSQCHAFSHASIYALGLMYLNGKGVQKDKKKAWDLIEKAAKLGNPAAMQKLLSRKG